MVSQPGVRHDFGVQSCGTAQCDQMTLMRIFEIMYYRFLVVADYESVIRVTDLKMAYPM